MNIGVLASHQGTTLQAVLDAISVGHLDARVTVVISNNSGSGALERARRAGIDTLHISSATHPKDITRDIAICNALLEHHVDLVLLAGYMKPIGHCTQKEFEGRVINTHPSLLPKFGGAGFYGLKVHRAVLEAGEQQSGATVHHVSGAYDTGKIIAQRRVPVFSSDTAESLQDRVKTAEQSLLLAILRDWPNMTGHDTIEPGDHRT